MAYFDNAATSFPKPEIVYEKLDEATREFAANPGRRHLKWTGRFLILE